MAVREAALQADVGRLRELAAMHDARASQWERRCRALAAVVGASSAAAPAAAAVVPRAADSRATAARLDAELGSLEASLGALTRSMLSWDS